LRPGCCCIAPSRKARCRWPRPTRKRPRLSSPAAILATSTTSSWCRNACVSSLTDRRRCKARSAGSTQPYMPTPIRRRSDRAIRSDVSSVCSGPRSSGNNPARLNEAYVRAWGATQPRHRRPALSLRRGCPAHGRATNNAAAGHPLFLLEAEPSELLLETRKPAAAVDQLLLTAGPGRVGLGVDVEAQRVTRLAAGRAGGELGTIGHDDLDGVVLGMGVGLHGQLSRRWPRSSLELLKVAALYITPPA